MVLSIALAAGCDDIGGAGGADGVGGSAAEPTYACGKLTTHARVECLNEHEDVYDFRDNLALLPDVPQAVVYGGDADAACVPLDDRGGDTRELALEATCGSVPGPAAGLRRELRLHGAVTRTCNSAVHLWLDYAGTLQLPEGLWRVRVDASSDVDYLPNSGNKPACTLRVGGADADLIREGESNVWLSFEQGPRDLALELDCTDETQYGLAGIVCFGWAEGQYPPGPAVSVVQELDLLLDVAPVE